MDKTRRELEDAQREAQREAQTLQEAKKSSVFKEGPLERSDDVTKNSAGIPEGAARGYEENRHLRTSMHRIKCLEAEREELKIQEKRLKKELKEEKERRGQGEASLKSKYDSQPNLSFQSEPPI